MASINKVILIGNLGRDPEVRTTTSGSIFTTLRPATTRRYKGQDGNYTSETKWHSVILFGRTAEVARDYLKKGSSCYIEGRLRTRKYQDKQGIERWLTEIIGETLQLLGRNESGDGAEGAQTSQSLPVRAAQPAPQQPRPVSQSAAAADSSLPDDEDIPF